MSLGEETFALHLRAAGIDAAKRKMPAPNTDCQVCGGAFYASPGHKAKGWGKYCSMDCRSKAFAGSGNGRWLPHGDVTCVACGKEFHRKPSHMAAENFCSMACKISHRAKLERQCRQCGSSFKVYRAWAKRGGEFCSAACVAKAKSEKLQKVCVACGGMFEIKPSKARHKKGAGSYCSMTCKAKAMSASQLTVSGANRNKAKRGGKRQDLDGRYFRSGWEANYARYLNWLVSKGQIARWEFEPDTFEFTTIKRGSKFYTPDFKVFDHAGNFEYHEVKGWMDPASKTKLARMSRFYPAVKVVLIDSKVYRSIERSVKSLVGGWE